MASVATICLVCEGIIDFDEKQHGYEIECPDCGELFKIVSLKPLNLEYAYDLYEEPEYADEVR